LFGERDDQEWETALFDYGRTLPHEYRGSDNRLFTTCPTVSPAGDELAADFAETPISAEGPGDVEMPDCLFLATDRISDPRIDPAEPESAVAEELVEFPDVAYAIARGAVPDNEPIRAVQNNCDLYRSGSICIVFEPGRFINEMDGLSA
jgi:hypothetical protein